MSSGIQPAACSSISATSHHARPDPSLMQQHPCPGAWASSVLPPHSARHRDRPAPPNSSAKNRISNAATRFLRPLHHPFFSPLPYPPSPPSLPHHPHDFPHRATSFIACDRLPCRVTACQGISAAAECEGRRPSRVRRTQEHVLTIDSKSQVDQGRFPVSSRTAKMAADFFEN